MEELIVGTWIFTAHVECRPQKRNLAIEPPVEEGDLWYRVQISIEHDDGSGMCGVSGDLSTSWQDTVKEAVEEAKKLNGFVVDVTEMDEVADKYVQKFVPVDVSALVTRAALRFELVTGNQEVPV